MEEGEEQSSPCISRVDPQVTGSLLTVLGAVFCVEILQEEVSACHCVFVHLYHDVGLNCPMGINGFLIINTDFTAWFGESVSFCFHDR